MGKPTIYRWWEDKCSLVMEAFFESMSTSAAVPTRDSTAAALAAHVQRVEKLLRGPAGRIVAEMVGEGQSQPTILTKFRERFFGQLLAPAREALTEGKRSGELDPQLDEEFVLDAVYGPMCYRLRLGHQPLTPRFAQQLGAQLEAMLSFDG